MFKTFMNWARIICIWLSKKARKDQYPMDSIFQKWKYSNMPASLQEMHGAHWCLEIWCFWPTPLGMRFATPWSLKNPRKIESLEKRCWMISRESLKKMKNKIILQEILGFLCLVLLVHTMYIWVCMFSMIELFRYMNGHLTRKLVKLSYIVIILPLKFDVLFPDSRETICNVVLIENILILLPDLKPSRLLMDYRQICIRTGWSKKYALKHL